MALATRGTAYCLDDEQNMVLETVCFFPVRSMESANREELLGLILLLHLFLLCILKLRTCDTPMLFIKLSIIVKAGVL